MARPAKEARDAVKAKFPEAVVVERRRNSIKHRIADAPDGRPRFVLDAGIGPMHFGPSEDQEIDTTWQPGTAPWDFEMLQAGYNAFALANFSSGQIVKYVHPESGESIAFQPQQLQYTNDLDQIQAVADPQSVQAVVQNEDELFWQGAYGPGFDLRWQAQTARLDKRLIIDQASRLPAPEQFILDGGNPVLRLQFIFAVSQGVDIFVNDELWDRKPNSLRETQTYVEFRLNTTGEVLWTFNLPRSFKNEEEAELLGAFRLARRANNLFVEHRVPLGELGTAVYPVDIDVTIDEQVAASADDCSQETGFFSNTQIFPKTGRELTGNKFWNSAHRFAGITIPAGSTIDICNGQLKSSANYTNTLALKLHFDDADSSGQVADESDFTSRSLTLGVDWDFNTSWSTGVFHDTLDFASELQSVIDRAGWASGNAVQYFIMEDGGPSDSRRQFFSYDDDPADASKLHIEYTAAGAGDLSLTASDGITVGEAASLVNPIGDVSLADGVTVGEAIAMFLPIDLPAFVDAVTIGEAITVDPLVIDLSATEAVTVAEVVTVSLPLDLPAFSDAVTLTDTPSLDRTNDLSVLDAVTVTDTANPDLTNEPSVSDAVTVGEAVTLDPLALGVTLTEAVTVAESVTVTIPIAGELNITGISDSVTVGEAVVFELALADLSVTDALTVGEAQDLELTIGISEVDAVTLGELAAVDPLLVTLIVSDAVTAGEAVTVEVIVPIDIGVVDALTVGEAIAVDPLALLFSVSDALTLGEAVTLTGLPAPIVDPIPKSAKWKQRQIERGIEVPESTTLRLVREHKQNVAEQERAKAEAESQAELRQAAERRVLSRMADQAEYEAKREAARLQSLINLELGKMKLEEEQVRQEEMNRKRRKGLQKARRKLKRMRKKGKK